jgi:hypothetical protein
VSDTESETPPKRALKFPVAPDSSTVEAKQTEVEPELPQKAIKASVPGPQEGIPSVNSAAFIGPKLSGFGDKKGSRALDSDSASLRFKERAEPIGPALAPEFQRSRKPFKWQSYFTTVFGILVLGILAYLYLNAFKDADKSIVHETTDEVKIEEKKEEPPVQPTPPVPVVSTVPTVVTNQIVYKQSEERYANGNLREVGSYKVLTDGTALKHGLWTNYWANGNLSTFGHFQDGKQIGVWPMWLDDGTFLVTNDYRAVEKK